MKKLKVAILGSGNIGTDLLIKIQRSEFLECVLFIGRNLSSPGMAKAIAMGVKVSDESINAIVKNSDQVDLVFDATSAKDAKIHWDILDKLGKIVVDMTPAKLGVFCIPAVNLDEVIEHRNVNMITCGGQASIPIAHVIGKTQKNVEYIEVVSSIASRSAGPATRLNLDEYVDTTENGIKHFSNVKRTKAILNLNPADPCIDMQTTIFAQVENPNMEYLQEEIDIMIKKIQEYVPGYSLLVPPVFENGRIVIMVKAQGLGDYLPKYAGNLDIINCAAIAVAEQYSKSFNNSK
ncbi:acetaldehyde dehydrogenase (acetylating) [Flavobacterium hercynium]|uniref:Acetaldehyde dehydrogenase n=1 Tax=Flavobacterium hercynium TaxID=387094 RepID=A0A226HEW7_9FLAO|nr:acetaldehyde dehydrogenase (acetylating) [Flavobacterium hercynium]OXA92181.1 acetaldehyde dehydrogenase (acetylating) [Flavobacterium hercynium]SMP24555.1 acetaldehyde dehydrogenase [Flavobacterium hercynium]